jgi:hypothetical protein
VVGGHAELRAGQGRLQAHDLLLDLPPRLRGQRADIYLGVSLRRDHVADRPAMNHRDRDRRAVGVVVQFSQAERLVRHLDDGVDALLRRVPGVRRAAFDRDVIRADALAPGLQRLVFGGRFHHQRQPGLPAARG